MNINKLTFKSKTFPAILKTIPSPPRELYVTGNDLGGLLVLPRLAIVGSRKISAYGHTVTAKLAADVARAGVVIISGLAIGADAIAHNACLSVGGRTIAVLPSGLDKIYPSSHAALAAHIIAQGGALLTEYPPATPPYPNHFIARNRLVAGLSQAVLITEAAQKSGTLHTVRFALEQGKDVLAVPGNITSATSYGTNNLLKTGATPVTTVNDILYTLGLPQSDRATMQPPQGDTPHEQAILRLVASGISDGNELLARSNLEVRSFHQAMTMLEIRGVLRPLGLNKWALT